MTSQRPQFRSWQNLLILGSLCLNVILGTYIALQWFKPTEPQTMTPTRLFARVAEKLPKEDADILWRVYRGRENEIVGAQADYDRALSNTLHVLAEPNLNAEALQNAIADARDKRLRIGTLVSEAFLSAFLQISPQGRHTLGGEIQASKR